MYHRHRLLDLRIIVKYFLERERSDKLMWAPDVSQISKKRKFRYSFRVSILKTITICTNCTIFPSALSGSIIRVFTEEDRTAATLLNSGGTPFKPWPEHLLARLRSVAFFLFLRGNPGLVPRLEHDLFVPNFFHFISYLTIRRHIVYPPSKIGTFHETQSTSFLECNIY
jgi:hypothetical protein